VNFRRPVGASLTRIGKWNYILIPIQAESQKRSMETSPLGLQGLFVIEPDVSSDEP
jgi:hypothetical protein